VSSPAKNHFRLNVGFLINLPVGESRDFLLEVKKHHFEPDLDLEDIHVRAHISKAAQGLLVQVQTLADIQTECVRCLVPFNLSLKTEFTELYAFAGDSTTESGLTLPDDAHINLEPLLREYMILEIPMSPLCTPECKGLCPVCGENLNEVQCTHEYEAIDPRFEKLKYLLNNK
jgi:uncharacterized protein